MLWQSTVNDSTAYAQRSWQVANGNDSSSPSCRRAAPTSHSELVLALSRPVCVAFNLVAAVQHWKGGGGASGALALAPNPNGNSSKVQFTLATIRSAGVKSRRMQQVAASWAVACIVDDIFVPPSPVRNTPSLLAKWRTFCLCVGGGVWVRSGWRLAYSSALAVHLNILAACVAAFAFECLVGMGGDESRSRSAGKGRGGERGGSGEGTLSKLLVSVYVTGSFVFTCG